jgi:hypothetical protein
MQFVRWGRFEWKRARDERALTDFLSIDAVLGRILSARS